LLRLPMYYELNEKDIKVICSHIKKELNEGTR
jgi:hypothetical protein